MTDLLTSFQTLIPYSFGFEPLRFSRNSGTLFVVGFVLFSAITKVSRLNRKRTKSQNVQTSMAELKDIANFASLITQE